MMKLNHINKSDLLVSPICMGTATIVSTVNEWDSFERLDMFYENGGNFLDSSNVYADWIEGIEKSVSEKTIGKWIKNRNLASEIIVATKGGHGELHGPIIGKTRLSREELNEQIQKSLENLCVNSIGLYYLHRDDISIPVENIMDTLLENIDKGYIKNLGCSNWSLECLKLANEYAKKCDRDGFIVSSDRWSLAKFKPDKDPSIVPFNKERFEYIKEHNMTEIPFQAMARAPCLYARSDDKREVVDANGVKAGARYFLMNTLALLDQPGEFYMNPYKDRIYYKPRNAQNLTNGKIIIPKVKTLLLVEGSSDKAPVHNIRFEGSTVCNTNFRDAYITSGLSSYGIVPTVVGGAGNISLKNAENIGLTDDFPFADYVA